MRSDNSNSASSPRPGAGTGLCKAFKDMKSKVATHTGMSLSFVELVATSPAVSLLPALAPSPRSPSALLHRHMPLGHSIYSSVARKLSASEPHTCAVMENSSTQSTHAADTNAENLGTHNTFNIGLETAQSSSLSSSCDLSCGQASASGSASACMHPSVSSTCHVCESSHTDPSSASTHPSLSSTCHASENPSSSSSTRDLPCAFLASSTLTCDISSRHPSLSSVSCSSSSSLTCILPCANPSMSCGLSCEQLSSLDDLQCGHQFASSSSSVCDSLSEHTACSPSYVPSEEVVSDMYTSSADNLSSKNVDCCITSDTTSPIACKQAITVLRITSQIPSTTARVLYFLVSLIFAMSSISKGVCKSCMWVSSCVVYLHTVWHYITVMTSAGFVGTRKGESVRAEDDSCSNGKEHCFKVDASVGQQSSHLLKASCMKHSKFLKSKLRSSFKSLSVQVPRKAFAPLHLNTFPHSSSSSSSSLTPASPSSSSSHAVDDSSKARKMRMLKGSAFACKITRSFNQRQPSAVSPSSPGSQSQSQSQSQSRCLNVPTSEMVFSKTPSCEAKEQNSNRATTTNMSGRLVMAPVIALLVALCALCYGRGFGFIAVTTWLLAVSVANSVCSLWKKA